MRRVQNAPENGGGRASTSYQKCHEFALRDEKLINPPPQTAGWDRTAPYLLQVLHSPRPDRTWFVSAAPSPIFVPPHTPFKVKMPFYDAKKHPPQLNTTLLLLTDLEAKLYPWPQFPSKRKETSHQGEFRSSSRAAPTFNTINAATLGGDPSVRCLPLAKRDRRKRVPRRRFEHRLAASRSISRGMVSSKSRPGNASSNLSSDPG